MNVKLRNGFSFRGPALRWLPTALSAIAVLTAACASLKPQEAPNCSGLRRPANPHGSVLAPEAPPPGSGSAPGQCLGGPK